MCSQNEVYDIVARLRDNLTVLFPNDDLELILYGSDARNEAQEGSDIDVMVLVDASRQEIAERNWQVGEVASDLLMDCGVVVSPIVENRDYFHANAQMLPFFRNVQREGVAISA